MSLSEIDWSNCVKIFRFVFLVPEMVNLISVPATVWIGIGMGLANAYFVSNSSNSLSVM